MANQDILINWAPQETRVAIVENGAVQELHIERALERLRVGGEVTRDLRALLTYVHAFDESSPVHGLIARALRGRSRRMFTSIADALVAKGERRGEKRGRRAGLSEGLAQAVLGVLASRSFRVPASVRRRVSSSGDEHQLRRWLERAVTAESLDDVFDDA